jgi:predicted N-acetyltransferase YhbS
LLGVAILESKFIGSQHDSLQLKFLHVSRDYRKQGIASTLFKLAVEKAKGLGAKKLYISATPSENTVNYYMRLGCAGKRDRPGIICAGTWRISISSM